MSIKTWFINQIKEDWAFHCENFKRDLPEIKGLIFGSIFLFVTVLACLVAGFVGFLTMLVILFIGVWLQMKNTPELTPEQEQELVRSIINTHPDKF